MERPAHYIRYEQLLQEGEQQQNSEDAITIFTRAIQICPERSEAYTQRGIHWLECRRIALAERDFRQALAIQICSLASYQLAFLLSDRGEHHEANLLIKQALRYYPADGELWYLLGIIYDRQNYTEHAIDALQQADAYNCGQDSGLLTLRARLWNEQGNWEQAIYDCNNAIKYGGIQAEVYFQQGWAEFQLKRWHAAHKSFTRAITDDPCNPAAYRARSLVHRALGNTEAANRDLRHALHLEAEEGEERSAFAHS
jgi:Flp pilus assembly protein TadD